MLKLIMKKICLFIYFIILIEVILKFLNYFNNKILIVSTFYINYQDGFIRRGLFGSILHFFSKYTFINPFKFQIIFFLIVIVVLFYLIIRGFYKHKIEFYILFGSFMLLNVIAFNMFFFIDIFFIVFFVLQMYVINKIDNINTKLIVINLMSIFMILNHEAYFIFTFFPILYLLNVNSFSVENVRKIVLLSPSFIVFLLMVLYFNGRGVDTNVIIDSWKGFGGEYLDQISKLYWTFNSTDEVVIWKISIFKNNPIYLVGFFINLVLIFLCMLIYLNNNFKSNSKYIFTFLLFQYFAIILISLIAIDYVRWFWLANIITIFTLLNVNSNMGFLKQININISNRICYINRFIILFIGLPLGGSWSPIQFIYTMPIKHFFDFGNRVLSLFA